MKIGQLCLKIAGRDGGNFVLIVDKIDDNYVLIDGNVRRKKCNIKHLEAISGKILKIKKGASTNEVKKALEQEGIKIIKKGEKRTPKPRLIKKRKIKQEPVEEKKEEKKKEIKKIKKEKKSTKKNA